MIDEKKLVEEICNTACKVYEFETDELLDAFMLGLNAKQICVMDLIAKQPKVGRWIPVEERLPEQSLNSVIGWDAYRERCVFVQYYMNKWILGNHETVKIIAWMPLPKPYRKEDK